MHDRFDTNELRELDVSPERSDLQPPYISAASGLVCVGSHIYVVADDELCLGVFSAGDNEPGHRIRLFAGELPIGKAERKRQKPDLETIVFVPAFEGFSYGALLALGSGSGPNRGRGILLGLDPQGGVSGSPEQVDMAPMLGPLHQVFADLNIEGAAVVGDELLLFQRGNKKHMENAIIHYSLMPALVALRGSDNAVIAPSSITRVDLGTIEGVPLCFTDAAALPNGDVVFCAVAEDTHDAYRDGDCAGAAIGIVDKAGRLLSLHQLEKPHKVEGISAQTEDETLDLLLVTDADDPAIPAKLLSASIPL
ncbi:hypothetical protein ASG42_27025 [Rhizobium sp. Leaf391]|uniref:DUF6929 family protein n=1 Tax=Rhizobium sp. Leaf391 TaxID=1736360 RepID=UPI000715162B|nr:hypothetical protein [Rhizobium sp. Leaf391]KQT01661.1 hypothetical protein ASG42_27025 [Rhizobium sp. Leaf391]